MSGDEDVVKIGIDDYDGDLDALIEAATDAVPCYALPAPGSPMAVARVLVEDWTAAGALTMRRWQATWMLWTGTKWVEAEAEAVEQWAYLRTEHAVYLVPKKEDGEIVFEERPWSPDEAKIRKLMKALAAVMLLPRDVEPPTWLDGTGEADVPAEGVIFANGVLDLASGELTPHSPRLFSSFALPFDYQPDAGPPTRWLEFLHELWPDDPDCIALLQEWFGYLISGRTDLHKIMLRIGPPRAGKGVISRIENALLGLQNVAAPSLAQLAEHFGLQGLIGKSLAMVGDARDDGRRTNTRVAVERLLSISGGDPYEVPRKNRSDWIGHLGVRFAIASNELPRLPDASGALVSRFLVLPFRKSFAANPDPQLYNKLVPELPGILLWALDGLVRLEHQGRFTVPASGLEETELLGDLASPTTAFVRELCNEGPTLLEVKDDLYHEWKRWCWDAGHEPGSKVQFCRNLKAAVHPLVDHRPRTGSEKGRPRMFQGIALKKPLRVVQDGPGSGPGSEDHPHPLPPAVVQDGPGGPGSFLASRDGSKKERDTYTQGSDPEKTWTTWTTWTTPQADDGVDLSQDHDQTRRRRQLPEIQF